MKTTFKRVLSFLLALTMVFGSVGVGVWGFDFVDIFSIKAGATNKITDYKQGDIIEYGSYPQSEVEDENLLSELNSLSLNWISYGYFDAFGPSKYMKYADVTYDGASYRAVKFSKFRSNHTNGGDSFETGTYQDENGYFRNTVYWFRYEPLKWRILDAEKGLVMCESIIDAQAFNNIVDQDHSISDIKYSYFNAKNIYLNYASSYATSTIRTWLNNRFYDTAFSSNEQNNIKTTIVDNTAADSKLSNAQTQDKIFALSYNQITNSSYGFSDSTTSSTRLAQGTDYAKCQGLYVDNSSKTIGTSHWWLRTAGRSSRYASCIDLYGNVKDNEAATYICGIRPAMVLSSYTGYSSSVAKIDIYTLPLQTHYNINDKINTDGLAVTVTYNNGASKIITDGFTCSPSVFTTDGNQTVTVSYEGKTCSFNVNVIDFDYSVGDIFEFGSYPQSEVTDTALLSSLNALTLNWISYGYYSGDNSYLDYITMQSGDWMKYADIMYNGTKYRGVVFTEYRPQETYNKRTAENSKQDDNGYYTNVVHWFKYEPLKWRVLDPVEGFVMSESIIDAQPFTNTYLQYTTNHEYYNNTERKKYANDYETSSIRNWLNEDFYNTAFSEEEKSQIYKSGLDNSCVAPSINMFNGPPTYDKIFLLSMNDVAKTSYGFTNYANRPSATRQATGTAYAKCQGLLTETYSDDCSRWLLRSASYYSSSSSSVDAKGIICDIHSPGGSTTVGIRPAFKFNPQAISNIKLEKAPNKTTYVIGEEFDSTGLSIVVIANDGTTRKLTSGFVCSPTNLNTVGKQSITVSYGGKTFTFKVTVNDVAIEYVEMKTSPTTTEYFVGDALDTTGLTLEATYNNGTNEIITNGFTCTPATLDIVGAQTITVTYDGKTCAFDVIVKAVQIVKTEIKTFPAKTEYFVGDVLDTTGLSLITTYKNDKTNTITSGFVCSPTILNTAGTQTITVTYGEQTCTFDVTVKSVEPGQTVITTLPTKTEYFVGDTLDTTGLTLETTYNNGTAETITSDFVCSPTTLNTTGTQTITVTYGGITCTFDVTVKNIELVKIDVNTPPIKTEYFVGDTLDTTGLTLEATYNNGTAETITSDIVCLPTTLNTAGTQTVTVTYGGKTCTFKVEVVEKDCKHNNRTITQEVPPTCIETGIRAFTCNDCDKSFVEPILATGHSYVAVVTPPTYTEQGYTTYTCSVCDDTYVGDYVDALGHTHSDNDGDGYCDDCDEILDQTVKCGCNCHKSGIAKFFFRFILFFQKLFGSNKICECGVAHY